jgi:hypothetical protein
MRRGGVEARGPTNRRCRKRKNTLKRLRERQIEAQAADEALIELDAASGRWRPPKSSPNRALGHD